MVDRRLPVGTLARPANWSLVLDDAWNTVDWLDSMSTCTVVSHNIMLPNTDANMYVYVLTYSSKTGYVLNSSLVVVT